MPFFNHCKKSLKGVIFCIIMNRVLQNIEENYHEVCHNCLSYSAISAIVSGKGSRYALLYFISNSQFQNGSHLPSLKVDLTV